MEENKRNPEVKRSFFSKLTGNMGIRGKLMMAFMTLIALTVVVIVITVISQTVAQRTIEELVQVHGKVARLSLETEKTLRVMQNYEKDFLLNYEEKGIQVAKTEYLDPFIAKGGEIYQTLHSIEELATNPGDAEAAQSVMNSINEYLIDFMGIVNILELRVDKEFGELVKLNESVEKLEKTVSMLGNSALQDGFFRLKTAVQDYLRISDIKTVEKVEQERETFNRLLKLPALSGTPQATLQKQLKEFDKWFTEVTNTDRVIAAKASEYEDAVKRTEPVIKSFLSNAVANEAKATAKMKKTADLVLKAVIVVGAISVLLAILIAIRLSRGLTGQVNHIMDLLGEIGMGNFSARTKVVSNDELGEMATTLNAMLDNITALIQSQEERDAIQESIMKLLEEISALTEGDFTGRAEVTEDMTGAIADSFNAMADQFSDIISKVKKATQSVDLTTEDVSQQTMALANKNIEQVKSVTEAVEAIEDMVASIREVARNAQTSAEVSKRSRSNAQEGAEAVSRTNRAMTEIREQINETARSIKRLGESSMEIGNIVQIIDDIADRTSILALNASIQAAMAGEAGHGFAVVADEVQRLADSSRNSTKQIDLLVKSIQTEIADVSNRMDESISKVVGGTQLADGAYEKLQEIEAVSRQLAELIEAITAATTSQVEISESISQTMQEVGEISRESSLSSQDTAASMNVLSKTARDLREAVEIFKVEEEESA